MNKLTYADCAELKEAGLKSQIGRIGAFFYKINGDIEIEDDRGILIDPEREDIVVIPNLKELIEACGEAFGSLTKFTDKDEREDWGASNNLEDGLYYQGFSPEQAVARLYCALNPK